MNETKILNATLKKELAGIAESLKVLTQGISKEQFAEVLQTITQHLEKPQGDKGETGDPGYTPKRGKDYYTIADIKAIIAHVQKRIKVPARGKDFWTKEDIDFVVNEAYSKIVMPEAGKDYYTPKEKKEIVDEITKKLKPLLAKSIPKATQIKINRIEEKAVASVIGRGVKTITVGPEAPPNPKEGDLWVQTT